MHITSENTSPSATYPRKNSPPKTGTLEQLFYKTRNPKIKKSQIANKTPTDKS